MLIKYHDFPVNLLTGVISGFTGGGWIKLEKKLKLKLIKNGFYIRLSKTSDNEKYKTIFRSITYY